MYGLVLRSESECGNRLFEDAANAFKEALHLYNLCYSFKEGDKSDKLVEILGNYGYCLYRTKDNIACVNSIVKYLESVKGNDRNLIYLKCYMAYDQRTNLERILSLIPRYAKVFNVYILIIYLLFHFNFNNREMKVLKDYL